MALLAPVPHAGWAHPVCSPGIGARQRVPIGGFGLGTLGTVSISLAALRGARRSKGFPRAQVARFGGSQFTVAGRDVRVLEDEAAVAEAIAAETADCARSAIAEKGAFSLCVPGGLGPADGKADVSGATLIGKALQSLSKQGLDFQKWHVFFAGERLDSQESFQLAKKLWIDACGIPEPQVHPVPQMLPAEGAAAQYTAEICMQDESVLVDSDEGLPALDLLLLDVAADGTVGRLCPDSPEIAEAGTGKVILPVEDLGAEAAVASMDFMNAARRAVVVATGSELAATASTALGDASPSCPASMLRASKTTWLLDSASAASVK